MIDHKRLLAKKLNDFLPLSEQDLQILAQLHTHSFLVQAGKELVHEGQTGHMAYILLSGWVSSYKLLPNGGRQIIGFPLPGDWIGLRSVLLRTADHSFSAFTDAVVSGIEASRMRRIVEETPRLGVAILLATSQDESMVVEHLVNLGRRSAIERTAHFFLELYERLQLIGLADDQRFECPLNQYVLADALGLSAIHVNRVLRQLRERALLTLKDHSVDIHDKHALMDLAGYEPHQRGGQA